MMSVSMRLPGMIALMLVAGVAELAAARADGPRTAQNSLWLIQNETHSRGGAEKPSRESSPDRTGHELNTLKDIFVALRRCYVPPSLDQARPGMRMTVQFAYTRQGEIFGKPRILYETQGTTPEQQSAYRMAVAAALARCSPLPFSKSLGAAVAGRVFAIQFIDERTLRGA